MTRPDRNRGFTLVELLVVITIIAILGALAVKNIPGVLRAADRTACEAHLKTIYEAMLIYQQKYHRLSPRSGPDFVMSIWDSNCMGKTEKDAKILFCPSMAADTTDITADGIDYTGPIQNEEGQRRRKPLRTQNKNANNTPIVADRMPVDPGEDLDNLPHAGEGVLVLFLGGAIEFIESHEYDQHGYVVFGPDSPDPRTQGLLPDDY